MEAFQLGEEGDPYLDCQSPRSQRGGVQCRGPLLVPSQLAENRQSLRVGLCEHLPEL